MLKLKPNSECCNRDLPACSREAMICTFECTFCLECVETKLNKVLNNLLERLFCLLFLIVCFAGANIRAQTIKDSNSTPAIKQMLETMAETFRYKIQNDFSIDVQINIQPALESGYVDEKKPARETWSVSVAPGKKIELDKASNDKAAITFYTTEIGLRLMFEGKYNPTTAALQHHGGDPLYLSFPRTKEIEQNKEILARIQIFKHFFNPTLPDKTVLDVSRSRLSHGIPAVGLYYYPGFRSAWHQVKKGVSAANKPGDTKPYHQAYIFISGTGKAKIGDKIIEVKGGESYYVPPGSDNVIWTESDEPLTYIWLAWGDGA